MALQTGCWFSHEKHILKSTYFMITLASYMRSGNTFLRNVLYEVYGIESATYLTAGRGPDENWQDYPVVKTHLLPAELPEALAQRPVVYLIRDGRDSMVSCAHYWKDIVRPESTFEQNILEVIYAAEGSYFGGWSKHVEQWVVRAVIVIRFEDLIRDPLGQCQRLAPYLDLSNARPERLPDFKSQKQGEPQYGSGKGKPVANLAGKWFRRGQVGSWRDELNEAQHELMWHLHGETMEVFGYGYLDEQAPAFDHLRASFQQKTGQQEALESGETHVLIEASKLHEPFVDGIKRYVHSLVNACLRWPTPVFRFHLLVDGAQLPLTEEVMTQLGAHQHKPLNTGVLFWLKSILKWLLPKAAYNALAKELPLQTVRSWFQLRSKTASSNLAEERMDIMHVTLPQHYRFMPDVNIPVVGTVHDQTHVSHPQYHEENNVRLTTKGMEWLREKEAHYIAVSQSTKDDLGAVQAPVTVVPEGVDRKVFYPIQNTHLLGLVRERYGLPEGDFMLSVCTLEPRKNLRRLIEAYAALPGALRNQYPLVLAGRKGWKWADDLVPESCKEHVCFTGFVREDHLPALYTLAYGFCYISLYEGFGLPVLEAMACGCPVVVSSTSSLPEVVGEAGLYADPEDTGSIQNALMQLLQQPEKYRERSRAVMHQSWKFTWSRCLEQTLSVYYEATQKAVSPPKKTRASSQTAG